MIKNITLIIVSLFLYSCGLNSQRIDASINPADRHIWVPKDSDDFEKQRLIQTHLDGITKEIETLFFNLEMITPIEANVRESAKGVISKIEAMKSDRNNQISNEKKRVDYLNKELTDIRTNSKEINTEVVNMYLSPVFTRDEYINAFYYFKKGAYRKSAALFKNMLRLNPPQPLIDNLLFGLGMSYYKMNNFSKIIKPFSRIIKRYPNSDKWYMSHVMLALGHEKKGEKSQALYILEQAVKNDPPYFFRSVINKLINIVQDGPIYTVN